MLLFDVLSLIPLPLLPRGEGECYPLPVGEGAEYNEAGEGRVKLLFLNMFTVSTNSKEKLSPALLEKARTLRKTATAAEVFLWQILRRRKLNGLKFRRQHPLQRGFILDFYCDELKLGIELDGAIHNSKIQSEYDRLRTIEINFQAINIIRFRNEEVLDNTEYVLDSILKFGINN